MERINALGGGDRRIVKSSNWKPVFTKNVLWVNKILTEGQSHNREGVLIAGSESAGGT